MYGITDNRYHAKPEGKFLSFHTNRASASSPVHPPLPVQPAVNMAEYVAPVNMAEYVAPVVSNDFLPLISSRAQSPLAAVKVEALV